MAITRLTALAGLIKVTGVTGLIKVIGLIGVTAATGCAHRPPPSPTPVLTRYLKALRSDDPRAAYQLLDSATQKQLPLATFLNEWRDSPAERAAQAAALQRRLREPPQVTTPIKAVVKPAGADSLQAELLWMASAPIPQTQGRTNPPPAWLLSSADLRAVRPDSPEEALRLLTAAAEARDYQAVLRLLSPGQRQFLETELRERIDRLKAALSAGQQAAISGDSARFQYDPRFHVELKKEEGAWWIVDLN